TPASGAGPTCVAWADGRTSAASSNEICVPGGSGCGRLSDSTPCGVETGTCPGCPWPETIPVICGGIARGAALCCAIAAGDAAAGGCGDAGDAFGSVGRVSRATFGSGDTGACATGGAAGVAVGAVGAAACGATGAGAAGCWTEAGGDTDFTTSCSWLPGGRVCIGGGVAPDAAAGAGCGAVTVADSVWPGCGRLAGGRAADGSGGL